MGFLIPAAFAALAIATFIAGGATAYYHDDNDASATTFSYCLGIVLIAATTALAVLT